MTALPEEDLLAQAEAGAADADGRNAFRVDIDGFEGPLHLLLELARRYKIDLAKISILQLADQRACCSPRAAKIRYSTVTLLARFRG